VIDLIKENLVGDLLPHSSLLNFKYVDVSAYDGELDVESGALRPVYELIVLRNVSLVDEHVWSTHGHVRARDAGKVVTVVELIPIEQAGIFPERVPWFLTVTDPVLLGELSPSYDTLVGAEHFAPQVIAASLWTGKY